jgi:hypothetical protein
MVRVLVGAGKHVRLLLLLFHFLLKLLFFRFRVCRMMSSFGDLCVLDSITRYCSNNGNVTFAKTKKTNPTLLHDELRFLGLAWSMVEAV